MLLGLSSTDDEGIDPAMIRSGAGVSDGPALVDLVDALVSGDRDAIDTATMALDGSVGVAARIDAIAVMSNFEMMTRVADGTGTPLDRGTVAASAPLRSALALDELESARL